MNNNLYFALDVGTRTVIGLVLEKRQNKYHILAAVIEEHSNRAMLDGQIHDIPSVIAIIKKVKTKL
jgi:cell division ATPase FtsA